MEKQSMLSRLQQRWGVKSTTQVIVILIVFAATGFSMMYIKIPLYQAIGINKSTPTWLRVGVWCITILPLYQVTLLFYGTLLGQFRFFWEFEKRMFRGLLRPFMRKKK